MIRRILPGVVAAFLATACGNLGEPTGPLDLPNFNVQSSEPVCHTIGFGGFLHGDQVNTVASGFGFDISIAVTPGGERSANFAVVYDTDFISSPLSQGPDFDLEWQGPNAQCPDCEGLGGILVIPDKFTFATPVELAEGDSQNGGTIIMTGFAGNGPFFIMAVTVIDNDTSEQPVRIFVDGSEVGASSQQGNGSVEIVSTSLQAFDNTLEVVNDGGVTASGGIDDLVLCRPADRANGRMTGGGGQLRIDGVRITRGFTIHCDIALSNNLEINWTAGNKWHLNKPLTSAECIDDPKVNPEPPPAPFDTFIGEGTGRLNGVDGSVVRFTFVDAGEPGRNDRAAISIWAPGDDPDADTPVLEVLGFLDNGNLQAHFDQPHG